MDEECSSQGLESWRRNSYYRHSKQDGRHLPPPRGGATIYP